MRDGGFQAPPVLPNAAPKAPEAPKVEEPKPPAEPMDVESFITEPAEDERAADTEAENAEVTEDTEESDTPEGATGDKDAPKDSKAENFKALRTKVKEVSTELSAAKREAEELKKKLEEFQTGTALPEVLKEKEARIAQLEPLEHLHALRTSRLYHDKYIKPITELQEQLKQLATDYDISPEAFAEASKVQNPAELNRWLSEHFDPLGAQDAREIIRKVTNLQEEAFAAEKEPQGALSKLVEEAQAAEAAQRSTQLESIHKASRRGWVASLQAHKEAGKLHELIPSDNDENHNNTYVKPVLTKAGAEYGKIVKHLFQCGLKELPDDLAYALANMCQLAHASGVQAHIREQALQHAREIEASAASSRRFNRPPVGGSSGMTGVPNSAPAERMTPEQAARLSREAAQRK